MRRVNYVRFSAARNGVHADDRRQHRAPPPASQRELSALLGLPGFPLGAGFRAGVGGCQLFTLPTRTDSRRLRESERICCAEIVRLVGRNIPAVTTLGYYGQS